MEISQFVYQAFAHTFLSFSGKVSSVSKECHHEEKQLTHPLSIVGKLRSTLVQKL